MTVGAGGSDTIDGSPEAEIISGREGKDFLTGGAGPDGFLFQYLDKFGKKHADIIHDFDPSQNDSILINKTAFDIFGRIKLETVAGKKATSKAAATKNEFIYDEHKGFLFFNENGKQEGWGDGGLFVKLKGAPELGIDDFTFLGNYPGCAACNRW